MGTTKDTYLNIYQRLINHDFKYLASFLEEDKNKKHPTNKLLLLEIFITKYLMLNLENQINIIKDESNDWFDEYTFNIFYITLLQ